MGCRRATCTWADDRVAVVGVVQLPQGGLLHAGVGLLVAEAAGLPGQGAVTTVMGRKSSRW